MDQAQRSSLDALRRSAGSAPNPGANARETAYRIIRDKIISLDIKPGESLSDKQLAEELAMSRTPVREAIILLASANMVILKPQIGTFVAPIDVERMEMEQFARYALEKEIITLACGAVTPEVKWRYEENLRAYKHYSESDFPGRSSRLLDLDNEFHRIAFLAAGRENNFDHMLAGLLHVERMRMLSLAGLNQEQTLSDHCAISQAVTEGDRPTALKWLELHLNRYQENVKVLRERFPEYFTLDR